MLLLDHPKKHRQTDRQIYKQRDRWTDGQTDRQRERDGTRWLGHAVELSKCRPDKPQTDKPVGDVARYAASFSQL